MMLVIMDFVSWWFLNFCMGELMFLEFAFKLMCRSFFDFLGNGVPNLNRGIVSTSLIKFGSMPWCLESSLP